MKFETTARNKIFVLPLLSAVFLLSSCSSENLDEELSREYKTYIGEFKFLGEIEVQEIITHIFETEDGEILYAYSDRYELDDENSFGDLVEAYGVVTSYENLDKPLFEVKQISDVPDEEEIEEITQVEYKDPDLGFSISHPSNWALTSTPSSVIIEAPIKTNEEELPNLEKILADSIVIEKSSAVLTKTAEDTQEDRVAEIRSYVVGVYTNLVGIESDLTYAGPDRLLSVRYKTSDGDTTYFIPRETELFELSYYHEDDLYNDRLENSNVFASLVSGFQFTPYGEGDSSLPVEESAEESNVVPSEVSASDLEQISVKSYRELESVPYEFIMSYPGNWYYGGSSNGYEFSDQPTDDENSVPILSMLFNSGSSDGISRSGETVSITVTIDGRSYTISGPSEYETVMQSMMDSIRSTK